MTRPLNRRMITFSIMAATIMQTLDTTIANVALPLMQGTLSASQDRIRVPTNDAPWSPARK